MIVGYSFQLVVECPRCKTWLACNGACAALTCATCGVRTELADEFWQERFDPDDFAPFALADGATAKSQPMPYVRKVYSRVTYGKQMPVCSGCTAPIDTLAVRAGIAAGSIACPRCSRAIRVRAPDARVRRIDPHAIAIVDEAIAEVASATEPQTFYVVCEYDAAQARAARWRDEDTKKSDARSSAVGSELAELARDDDDQVRIEVAKNPHASPDVLALLAAEDDDDDVRMAAIAHPATPLDALRRVAVDEEESYVVSALCDRDGLPPEIVEELARSSDHHKRRLAAAHPSLPKEWLGKLEKDEDESVREAALARIRELRAQGIDVPGRGFFRKLFGG